MSIQRAPKSFAIVPDEVLFSDISAGALRLYAVLSCRANMLLPPPSNKELEKACGVSRRTIQKWKAELIEAGFVYEDDDDE